MGTELRRLFALALPLAAAEAGTQIMSVVDMAVIGRLGGLELAAAGLGNAVFFGVAVFGLGLMLGVDPLISQAVGARDFVSARRVMWQGVWLALITSAVLTALLLCGPFLLRMIGVKPEIIGPASSFLLIRTIGLAPWLVFFVVRAYLQAHHVTRPMVVSMVVANVFNLMADIVLVFGGRVLPLWFGPLRAIPPLGVAGAAISTASCQFVQLAIVAAAVVRIEMPEGAAFWRKWNAEDIRRALRVGLPTALQVTAEVGIFALVALLAGHAAFIGAALVMSVGALLFISIPSLLARMLTNQANVVAAAIPLFFVAGLFQLSDGLQAAGIGALRGAADTRFAFLSNIVGYWIVGLPVALLLGFTMKMGVVGLWWGFVAGLTVVAILVFLRFQWLSAKAITPVAERVI